MEIVFATGNKNKLKEVKDIFKGSGFSFQDLTNFPNVKDIPETGNTFQANALLKSSALREYAPESIIMADDSGLCVEALGGAPGVFSARYAGQGATYTQLCEKLLAEMKDCTNRKAYFVSVYAIIFPDGSIEYTEGRLDGEIAFEMVGDQGFGYDPVFIYEGGGGKTLAQISLAEKSLISHRARALAQVKELLCPAK